MPRQPFSAINPVAQNLTGTLAQIGTLAFPCAHLSVVELAIDYVKGAGAAGGPIAAVYVSTDAIDKDPATVANWQPYKMLLKASSFASGSIEAYAALYPLFPLGTSGRFSYPDSIVPGPFNWLSVWMLDADPANFGTVVVYAGGI